MAITQIRGSQIKDLSIERSKLVTNFVKGATWELSDDDSAVLTGLATPTETQTNAAANVGFVTNYVNSLVDTTLKSPDQFDASSNGGYPTDYKGSGSVQEGDSFYVTNSGTVSDGTTAIPVNVGDLLVALVDNPGDTHSNWIIMESNRDQATETVKGVAAIATATDMTDPNNDTDIVTPKKLRDYLSGAGIQAYNFGNGLSVDTSTDPDTVQWGGSLSKDTSISWNGYEMAFYGESPVVSISATYPGRVGNGWVEVNNIDDADTKVYIHSTAYDDTTKWVELGVLGETAFINASSASAGTFAGIQYGDDYSSNFTDRSLVDKGFVTNYVTSTQYQIGSGLTLDSATDPGTLKLGGNVTENTTLSLGTNYITTSGDDGNGNTISESVNGSLNGGTYEVNASDGTNYSSILVDNTNGLKLYSSKAQIVIESTPGLGIRLNADVNEAVLENTPDGTVDEAIANVEYVKIITREIFNELPTVTDGSTDVTLSYSPISGTERVFRNGVRMAPGNDYTLSGNTISFVSTLSGDETVLVDYKY